MKRAASAVELRPAPKARARRTRRSVSIAPPKAGRGTECARPELSMCGTRAATRQGSSPERAETRAEMVANYGSSARLRAPRA